VTIRRGESWGEAGPLAADAPIVADDRSLRALVEAWRRNGSPGPLEVGLTGGDLCRTLGGPGDPARLRRVDAVRLPIDVVRVTDPDPAADGGPWWFAAHLRAHHRGWRGQAAVAMNAEWLTTPKAVWKLGPRSHPNDGLVDVTSGRLGWRDRLAARNRARSGDHVPHPALTVRRAAHVELDLGRPTPVVLDGSPIGAHRRLVLDVEPDAIVVVV